ncbi:hypothetical protein [Mastigocoleus testarum]|uniref:Uncharacterized protein n=1 Tax=Mastigocoleus testarum BC008 TaxID=371196 RepID=A0A0V7ZIY3_9CYAN|nr:hypothetical protein [Mastigocoleus testarum]KST64456.1 hypothetical protein BC008_17655 [Mastigocoleus testarum BC008]KST67785.1 hypothetical protein BC008_44375 [Mastigocoleus testarum BC008]
MVSVYPVDVIVRSHKLCREIKVQIPCIYQEIYDEARLELLCHVEEDDYNKSQLQSRIRSLDFFLKKAVYQRIDKLAINAQQFVDLPLHNPNKLEALTQLFNAIIICGRLKKPQMYKVDLQTYEDISADSLTELWRFICLKIDKFEANRVDDNNEYSKFMVWINSSMSYIIKRSYFRNIDIQSHKISKEYQIILLDEDNYESISAPSEEAPFAEIIRELIDEDPEKIFQNTCMKKHQKINFRTIALLSLEGLSMRKISEKLGVPQQSLYTFYNRSIKKFMPIFEKYLHD